MPSQIKICNLALSKIGARKIQSLNDTTKEAKECKEIYDDTRDATLRAHDWGFASKRQVLGLLTDTYTGWSYAYQYPVDCVKAREILDEEATTGTSYDVDTNRFGAINSVQFKKATNAGKNRVMLLTNKEDAELRYTSRVTDPNLFDSMFVDAFVFRLAADLAYPLRASLPLQQSLEQKFIYTIAQAKAEDANEDEKQPKETNQLVRSRY